METYTLSREQMESLFNAGIDFSMNQIRGTWKTQDEAINKWIEKKIDKNVNGDLDGTFEIKTWEEMIECCDRYDEEYKDIFFPLCAFTKPMENDMPEDRIIKVEKGYLVGGACNWHITHEMVKREVK